MFEFPVGGQPEVTVSVEIVKNKHQSPFVPIMGGTYLWVSIHWLDESSPIHLKQTACVGLART
jgi:hypothetical protein